MSREPTFFRFDTKWKHALKEYCKEMEGDYMGKFISRATIDEMKRRGIKPIEEEILSDDNL